MLAVPIVEGDHLVLMASFGGDDRDPAWYRNLNANPRVRVTFAGSTRTMIACTATDQEQAQLWPQITTRYRGYARYQQRTERSIPVVILQPDRLLQRIPSSTQGTTGKEQTTCARSRSSRVGGVAALDGDDRPRLDVLGCAGLVPV
jgi:deazaflavin-dependent oxidoreductase (nitroreductase family)